MLPDTNTKRTLWRGILVIIFPIQTLRVGLVLCLPFDNLGRFRILDGESGTRPRFLAYFVHVADRALELRPSHPTPPKFMDMYGEDLDTGAFSPLTHE